MPILQKNFRFEKNKIFEIFRNDIDEAHASIFDQYPLPRDVSNEKALRTYDFFTRTHGFLAETWFCLSELPYSKSQQPPSLLGSPWLIVFAPPDEPTFRALVATIGRFSQRAAHIVVRFSGCPVDIAGGR